MSLENQMFDIAKEAFARAYSPYSQFSVGAAVKFKNEDQIFSGCNIENASYGATVCAERVAIWKGVSDLDKREIETIVLVTNAKEFDVPCGQCLQVIGEFCGKNTQICVANLSGVQKTFSIDDLLPQRFNSERLLSPQR